MDRAAMRASLRAEAADLRSQARVQRQIVDQTVADVRAITATSRATLERSWETLARIDRSLRQPHDKRRE